MASPAAADAARLPAPHAPARARSPSPSRGNAPVLRGEAQDDQLRLAGRRALLAQEQQAARDAFLALGQSPRAAAQTDARLGLALWALDTLPEGTAQAQAAPGAAESGDTPDYAATLDTLRSAAPPAARPQPGAPMSLPALARLRAATHAGTPAQEREALVLAGPWATEAVLAGAAYHARTGELERARALVAGALCNLPPQQGPAPATGSNAARASSRPASPEIWPDDNEVDRASLSLALLELTAQGPAAPAQPAGQAALRTLQDRLAHAAQAAGPEGPSASLHPATAWLGSALLQGLIGDEDARETPEAAREQLRTVAPNSYAAMSAEVVEAPNAATQRAAWQLLTGRFPRSVKAVQLGIALGLAQPQQVAAVRAHLGAPPHEATPAADADAQAPQDLVQARAEYQGALRREDWPQALQSLQVLHAAHPSAQSAGQLAWLGQRAGKPGTWVDAQAQAALAADTTNAQACMLAAEKALATGTVRNEQVLALHRLAATGYAEAQVLEAALLVAQGRHDEALVALQAFLQPLNAASPYFGLALLMRAKHRLFERGTQALDHEQACNEVDQAAQDLQRVDAHDAAYAQAVQLQPVVAERREQVRAGVRYRLSERQILHEIAGDHPERALANLDHAGLSISNQESEKFWLLKAKAYEAMGPTLHANAGAAALMALELALMRNKRLYEAEQLAQRYHTNQGGTLQGVFLFLNGLLRWLASLGGGK